MHSKIKLVKNSRMDGGEAPKARELLAVDEYRVRKNYFKNLVIGTFPMDGPIPLFIGLALIGFDVFYKRDKAERKM